MPDPRPLDRYRARLIQATERILDGQPQADVWLRTPKVALNGQIPPLPWRRKPDAGKSKNSSRKSGLIQCRRVDEKQPRFPMKFGRVIAA